MRRRITMRTILIIAAIMTLLSWAMLLVPAARRWGWW